MNEAILSLIEAGGYWGIFALMVIENIFPPIPSEVIMGLGGMAVARGTMSFWPLLLIGTAGSTLGNYAWFLVGDRLGYRRLQPIVTRWGRWLTLEWRDVERARTKLATDALWVEQTLRFQLSVDEDMLVRLAQDDDALAHRARLEAAGASRDPLKTPVAAPRSGGGCGMGVDRANARRGAGRQSLENDAR